MRACLLMAELEEAEHGEVDELVRVAEVVVDGVLRHGGFVGDGAVIDSQFNTVDVAIVVKTDLLTEKYVRHYERTAKEAGP